MDALTEWAGAPRGAKPARRANPTGEEEALALGLRVKALQRQQDLLRDEIKRGKELLDNAKRRLAESRAILEEWPLYERRCGENCLPSLTEAVWNDRRVERFLTGWLKRRQEQLGVVVREMDLHTGQTTLEQFSTQVNRQAAAAEPRVARSLITPGHMLQPPARCAA